MQKSISLRACNTVDIINPHQIDSYKIKTCKYKIESKSEVLPSTGELEELARLREDDDSNLSITKNRELMSFLKQPRTPLGESNLSAIGILDPLNLDFSTTHLLISPKIE